jgi:hypothetical protein
MKDIDPATEIGLLFEEAMHSHDMAFEQRLELRRKFHDMLNQLTKGAPDE